MLIKTFPTKNKMIKNTLIVYETLEFLTFKEESHKILIDKWYNQIGKNGYHVSKKDFWLILEEMLKLAIIIYPSLKDKREKKYVLKDSGWDKK